MDEPCKELLAGSGRTDDEHRGGVPGHSSRSLEKLNHPGRTCDDLLIAALRPQLVPQPSDLAPELLSLLNLPQAEEELGRAEGLCNEVSGSTAHRFNGKISPSVGGHHDDWSRPTLAAIGVQEADPVGSGHPYISQDEIRQELTCHPETLGSVARRGNLITGVSEYQT
jgi:hypothetical protein